MKDLREELRIRFGLALRAGLVMSGAKAQFSPDDLSARLKPCPDTKLGGFGRLLMVRADLDEKQVTFG